MSAPVKVRIGTVTYGGFVQSQDGEISPGTDLVDISIHIPLTASSISLIKRRGFRERQFIVEEFGIETTYKLGRVQRVVGKQFLLIEGVSPE